MNVKEDLLDWYYKDLLDWYYKDNGFSSFSTMDKLHEPIVSLAHKIL